MNGFVDQNAALTTWLAGVATAAVALSLPQASVLVGLPGEALDEPQQPPALTMQLDGWRPTSTAVPAGSTTARLLLKDSYTEPTVARAAGLLWLDVIARAIRRAAAVAATPFTLLSIGAAVDSQNNVFVRAEISIRLTHI